MRAVTHRRIAVLCAVVLLTACASGSDSVRSTASSAEGTSPSNITSATSSLDSTATRGSNPSTSSTVPVDSTAQFTAADLPATGPCTLGAPSDSGQITFVVSGRLYGALANGTVQCLADLRGRGPAWLSWSPDGDELLAGPDTMLRADGSFTSTGYFADNTNVRWSAPTGKALLAPKASTGQLIWRNAHNSGDRIDVSFADNITSATYHPAGKHIAAAGIGRDGQGPGVFVASNRGANAQRIGQLEPGTTASDVTFDMSGTSLVFVHHHADGGSHIHRYLFDGSGLATLADFTDISPTDLTVSPVDDGDVAWTQTYNPNNSMAHVLLAGSDTPVNVNPPGGEHVSAPVGWMPAHRLVVSSRALGSAAAAPFALWEWSPNGMRMIINGVTAAATRTMHGTYSELTIIPGSGFG